ncbi:phage tail tape measure C-terminal domain-containing protein, partial [Staphylococcus aureus]|uniref:phage tail tape measure C-terminal domain-containing protein n=1 Tax=Staphylococcus aureus TaxID=1280 RepID=UPI001582A26D
MNRSVTAVDKLVATWGGARAYVEAVWDSFPEWFAGMMERAVNLAVAQWARLADKLRGAIAGVGESIDKSIGSGTGKLFTNMFSDIADQFKSSGELKQEIDFASDYINRYPDAVRKAGDEATQVYRDILLQRSKFLGELTSGAPKNVPGATKALTEKQAARLVPKVTFNDEVNELQKQIELISLESSERERLSEVLKIEDKVRNSIADTNARREFGFTPEEFQQIENMVGVLQRLKAESDVFDEIRKPQADLWSQMSALERLYRNQMITIDEYKKKSLELQIQLLEFGDTIESGVVRGVLKLQQEFTNLSTLSENMLVNSIHSAEDAFVQFVKTGKLEFKDLVDSILEDMIRLATRQSISGPLVQALGGVISSFFGPNISASANYYQGGVASNGVGLTTASGAAFATGGEMTVGGTGGVDSQMVNFRATPGEKIYIRKAGERDPTDGGGAAVAVKVNVMNYGGADVKVNQRKGEDGTPEIDILVD